MVTLLMRSTGLIFQSSNRIPARQQGKLYNIKAVYFKYTPQPTSRQSPNRIPARQQGKLYNVKAVYFNTPQPTSRHTISLNAYKKELDSLGLNLTESRVHRLYSEHINSVRKFSKLEGNPGLVI